MSSKIIHRIVVETKEVVVHYYHCTDKKVFSVKHEAEIHQGKLDGTIKECSFCNGLGVDAEGWQCRKCKGAGYLKQIWVGGNE